MANDKKKKNLKRLECLKKKIIELSILCDVDVLLLCKEDDPSSNSFYSWPEDRNSCLCLIDKYRRSSVPTKSYKKKTNSVSLSPVLGKRKESSYSQMDFCECVQENKKSCTVFVDEVDFDEFYGKFCESVKETQTVLYENVQENEKLELGFCYGIEYDENYSRFCKLIQGNQVLDKKVAASEKPEVELCQNVVQEIENFQVGVEGVDFDDFYGKFCKSVQETQTVLCANVQENEKLELDFFDGIEFDETYMRFCKLIRGNPDLDKRVPASERVEFELSQNNVQEIENFQARVDGVDFDDFYPKLSESIEEEIDLYQNVQKPEGFQKRFFDGLDSDEICRNFYQSIQENRDLSHTQIPLWENFQETEGFQMGFPDGVDFDEFHDSFCESIVGNTNMDNKLKESKKSEMISLKDVDGIINKLGHGDLKEILRWIDQRVTVLSKIKLL